MTRYRLLQFASVLLVGTLVAMFLLAGQRTPKKVAPFAIVAGAIRSPMTRPPALVGTTPAVLTRASDPVSAWEGDWHGVDGSSMHVAPDPANGANRYRVTLPVGMAGEMTTVPAETTGDELMVHRPYANFAFRRGSGAISTDVRLASKLDCLTTILGEAYCR